MNTNRQQKENVMLQTVWELPCLQKFYPKQSNTSLFCSLMMKIMNCHGNQCIIVRHRLGIYKHTSIESPEKMIRIRSLDFFDNFSFTEWYSWYAARCTVGSPILFSLRSLFNLPTSLSGCSVYWSWQMPMPVNT